MGGFGGNDIISGRAGDDILEGFDGDDVLNGGAGADRLLDDIGSDTFTGGEGQDVFVFRPRFDGSDVITDFQSGIDRIELHNSQFTELPGGPLTNDNFAEGTATDADDYIIFRDGDLFFDEDGSGAEDEELIASLGSGTLLVVDDIFVT